MVKRKDFQVENFKVICWHSLQSGPSPSFSRTWFFMMGHDFLRSRWCDWFQSLIKNFFSWNFSCSRKFCILRDTPYWTKPSCTSFNVNALIIIILTSVSQARLPFLGGEECGGETWWWNIKRVRVLSPPHMAWLCLQGVTKRKKRFNLLLLSCFLTHQYSL